MPRLQVGYVWHERGNKTEVVLQQRFEAMINPFRGPVSIIMHTKDDEDKEFRLNMEDKVQQKEMPNKRRPARQTRRSAHTLSRQARRWTRRLRSRSPTRGNIDFISGLREGVALRLRPA